MATNVVYSDKNNYVNNALVTEAADDVIDMIHNTSENEFIHFHRVAGDNIYILASSIISVEDF